jgi:hypothetical protein
MTEEPLRSRQRGRAHSLAIPSLIVSLAGLLITGLVSGTNIWLSSLQKDKELEIQKLKNDSDRQTTRGDLIFKNIRLLNSSDLKERQFAIAALVWTLGRIEADNLLASIQQFGPEEAQPTARKARNEIRQAELVHEARAKSWTGKWKHSFAASVGQGTGHMALRADDAGVMSGDFDAGSNVTGQIIRGTLSEDGSILTGTWTNNVAGGQSGRFYFELTGDQTSPRFRGSYSMRDSAPSKNSPNTWSGEKVRSDSGR